MSEVSKSPSTRRGATFSKRDTTAMIEAVRAAGEKVDRVEIQIKLTVFIAGDQSTEVPPTRSSAQIIL